jgi:DNA-binding MarR family transcriptional regulator
VKEAVSSDQQQTDRLHDSVDDHVAQWLRELPDLDPLTEAIITRMQKIVGRLKRIQSEQLARDNVVTGNYDVLHALRRLGTPYRAASSRLADDLMLSPSALTARIDGMEKEGLVRRVDDPDDRRRVLIEVTPEGHALWERTIRPQGEFEDRLVGVLDDREKETLAALLRRLLVELEREAD